MPNSTLTYYNNNAQSFSDSTRNVDMSALYAEVLPLIPAQGFIVSCISTEGK